MQKEQLSVTSERQKESVTENVASVTPERATQCKLELSQN